MGCSVWEGCSYCCGSPNLSPLLYLILPCMDVSFFFLPCEYILLCHLNTDDLNADDLTSQSEIKDLSCTVDDHIPAILL